MYYVESGQAILISSTLKEHGSPINVGDKHRRSAIHYAIMAKNTEALRALLDLSANVDAVDDQGNSALMYALEQKNKDMALMLLGKGADRSIRNAQNKTALDLIWKDEEMRRWFMAIPSRR